MIPVNWQCKIDCSHHRNTSENRANYSLEVTIKSSRNFIVKSVRSLQTVSSKRNNPHSPNKQKESIRQRRQQQQKTVKSFGGKKGRREQKISARIQSDKLLNSETETESDREKKSNDLKNANHIYSESSASVVRMLKESRKI